MLGAECSGTMLPDVAVENLAARSSTTQRYKCCLPFDIASQVLSFSGFPSRRQEAPRRKPHCRRGHSVCWTRLTSAICHWHPTLASVDVSTVLQLPYFSMWASLAPMKCRPDVLGTYSTSAGRSLGRITWSTAADSTATRSLTASAAAAKI